MLAIGGDPSKAVACPITPVEFTTVGSIDSLIPIIERERSDHDWVIGSSNPVTAAFEWSVTCNVPFERTDAIHVSTVPMRMSAPCGMV